MLLARVLEKPACVQVKDIPRETVHQFRVGTGSFLTVTFPGAVRSGLVWRNVSSYDRA